MAKHEPHRKRPISKTVRFTESEKAEVKRQQLKDGYNQFSAFARYRLVNSRFVNVSLIDGKTILPKVSAVGDQLNQIAHTTNQTGTVIDTQVGEVKELVETLKSIFQKEFSNEVVFK